MYKNLVPPLDDSDSLSSWALVRDALPKLAALKGDTEDGSRSDNTPSSEDSASLTELGNACIKRYENTGAPEYLEKAIAAFTRALEVTPDGKPDMRIRMINYGSALHSRSVQCGDPISDFEIAVFAFTFAAEVTPDDDPDKPRILCLLGASLQNRLQRVPTAFRADDIDNAVTAHRRAVELTPDHDSEKPWRLSRLGSSLEYRFKRLDYNGRNHDLDSAIVAYRQATELTSDKHRDKPSRLSELAASLIARFLRLGDSEDIGQAIIAARRAVELAPDEHLQRPEWQYNVADYLHMGFKCSGKLEDLECAIADVRQAIEITPERHPLNPWQSNRLGVFLLDIFETRGNADDLEDSIAVHKHAIELTPDDDPEKFQRLGCLSHALFRRYELFGDLGDLDGAVLNARHATELITRYWEQAWYYDSLGRFAWVRWERCGEAGDLDTVIAAYNKAVGHTMHDDPDKPRKLSNLVMALSCRYQRSSELEDLENLVETARYSVELSLDSDPNTPWRLHAMGESLQSRYERLYELEDLEGAIAAHTRASEMIHDDHPCKPSWLSSLTVSLGSRFERLRNTEDLDISLKTARRADELTPDGHPFKPYALNDVGVSLWRRFELSSDIEDLHSAIAIQCQTVDLTADDDPSKPMRLTTLAIFLRSRFESTKDSVDDLKAAEILHLRAKELNPDGHPGNSWLLERFGDCLRSRFGQEQTQEMFDATIKCYMDAADQVPGSEHCRLRSAESCVRLHSDNPAFSSPDLLLLAYSRIISVLPEITWSGHTVKRRLDELARIGGLVGAAVAAATAIGDVEHVVEWLEAGRTLVWSHIITMSMPTDELGNSHRELAEAMWDVQFRLAAAGFGVEFERQPTLHSTNREVSPAANASSGGGLYRRLVVEYERVVDQIRDCPGFEDFLRPKRFHALQSALQDAAGPVVFLNVAGSRCDAVIITSRHTEIVPLPSLTEQKAHKLRIGWWEGLRAYGVRERGVNAGGASRGGARDVPSRVLELLWLWIMHPILSALGIMGDPPASEPPHIIWCPTGPLLQLPLHAAGLYGVRNPSKAPGSRVYDFVVSSYTPSLSALERCLRGNTTTTSTPKVLVVTQPKTPRPGLSPLPCVMEESACIRRILPAEPKPTFLDHDEAIVMSTLEVVNEHAWVHFACHGSQNADDPTLSAFELHDGPLTLAALMTDRTAENSELAFLSACQTAKGDEGVPEESMHLAAGMLAVGFKGVVATMWSIMDQDAPVVVDAYYKTLLELRTSGTLPHGQTGAARALHEATKCLREKVGEDAFERWVPFIHFGA